MYCSLTRNTPIFEVTSFIYIYIYNYILTDITLRDDEKPLQNFPIEVSRNFSPNYFRVSLNYIAFSEALLNF